MEENWLAWITGIIAALNAAILAYQGWKKIKPEVKKMEGELELDNLEGAAKSQQLLLDRVNELKQQREEDLKEWKEELERERKKWEEQLAVAEKKRLDDVAYFKRRFRDADKEARSYRRWAAQLVKQVVEAGKVPAPYMPFTDDSETGLSAIQDEKDDVK